MGVTNSNGPWRWFIRFILVAILAKLYRIRALWLKGVRQTKEIGYPIARFDDVRLTKTMLGHIPALAYNFKTVYDMRLNIMLKHGKTFSWIAPFWNPSPTVSTTDPQIVKHILRDNYNNFLKSAQLVDNLGDLLGEGIFVVNHGPHAPDKGESWYFQRKTASKVFTRNIFKTKVHQTFVQNTNRLCKILDLAAERNTVLPLQKNFFRFTLDTIGEIGFGFDLNTLESEEVPFAVAFDNVQKLIARRMMRPKLGRLNFIYSAERELARQLEVLNQFAYDIIESSKQDRDGLKKRGDILSLFLQANPDLSDKFLRDVIMSFFIAGRDTTACTLSFTFLLLAQHPEIQEKLQKEVRGVDMSEFVDLEAISKLPYLHGVVMEALRLFPPVPVDGKQACDDDVLPDGTKITAGTKIIYETYIMGRNPDFWEEPLKFNPERWIDRKPPTEYEFPVFQAGPRFCLGKDLAVYEAKFLTAELLKRYTFELVGEVPEPPYVPGITLTVNGGLPVRVKKIN